MDVGCAVITDGSKILIAQRKEEGHLPGFWEFPGGKCDPGETMEACLKREAFEELGVQIQPVRFLCRREHAYPEKTVFLHFYLCRWLEGEPWPKDCQAVAWVLPEELKNYKFPPADDAVLKEITETSLIREVG